MSEIFDTDSFRNLLTRLADQACEDTVDAWPSEHLSSMAEAGVMAWDIPEDAGGVDLPACDLLEGLRLLASASLVSTFVLTQRSAAVRRIVTSTNQVAREALLPRLLSAEIFATVGISHLTTSGQHLQTPLVQATAVDGGYRLNGMAPWATGATMADFLITGGTLSDGRQILAAIPTTCEGIQVQPPVHLMALNASQTGAVRLVDVLVTEDELLHGPVPAVMQQGSGGGAGSLGTSALAIGATAGMLAQLRIEAQRRPDLCQFTDPLTEQCTQLTTLLRQASSESAAGDLVESLRRQANSLVLRTAQSWLAATKGAGYVAGHPAEQAIRESMFFLVWSCPQPVLAANLRELTCATASV